MFAGRRGPSWFSHDLRVIVGQKVVRGSSRSRGAESRSFVDRGERSITFFFLNNLFYDHICFSLLFAGLGAA